MDAPTGECLAPITDGFETYGCGWVNFNEMTSVTCLDVIFRHTHQPLLDLLVQLYGQPRMVDVIYSFEENLVLDASDIDEEVNGSDRYLGIHDAEVAEVLKEIAAENDGGIRNLGGLISAELTHAFAIGRHDDLLVGLRFVQSALSICDLEWWGYGPAATAEYISKTRPSLTLHCCREEHDLFHVALWDNPWERHDGTPNAEEIYASPNRWSWVG